MALIKTATLENFKPMGTPRPQARAFKRKDGKPFAKVYMPEEYELYKHDIQRRLHEQGFFDNTLQEILSDLNGATFTLIFELPFWQNQKEQKGIFAVTKPDIDNLSKGVLDAIFQSSYMPKNLFNNKSLDDSRVTGLNVMKGSVENKEDLGSITIIVQKTIDYYAERGFY